METCEKMRNLAVIEVTLRPFVLSIFYYLEVSFDLGGTILLVVFPVDGGTIYLLFPRRRVLLRKNNLLRALFILGGTEERPVLPLRL